MRRPAPWELSLNLVTKRSQPNPARHPDPSPDAFLIPVMATLQQWVAEGSLALEDLAAFNNGEIGLWELAQRRSAAL